MNEVEKETKLVEVKNEGKKKAKKAEKKVA